MDEGRVSCVPSHLHNHISHRITCLYSSATASSLPLMESELTITYGEAEGDENKTRTTKRSYPPTLDSLGWSNYRTTGAICHPTATTQLEHLPRSLLISCACFLKHLASSFTTPPRAPFAANALVPTGATRKEGATRLLCVSPLKERESRGCVSIHSDVIVLGLPA